MWAAIVFEEVPEEGALEQTWRYKLRFNASAVPSTKSRYDRYALGGYSSPNPNPNPDPDPNPNPNPNPTPRYALGGYSGTHAAYRQSGLLSLQVHALVVVPLAPPHSTTSL